MDRFSPDQIDRQLGEWLRDEATTRAPGHLVEDVFARTSRSRQASRWWPPHIDVLQDAVRSVRPTSDLSIGTPRDTSRRWQALSALAGALAIVMVVVLASLTLRPQLVGPGGTVVCGGIHMSDVPSFPYAILWGERSVRSVARGRSVR